MALLILGSRTTNLDDLLALVPDVLAALQISKSGDVVLVGGPQTRATD